MCLTTTVYLRPVQSIAMLLPAVPARAGLWALPPSSALTRATPYIREGGARSVRMAAAPSAESPSSCFPSSVRQIARFGARAAVLALCVSTMALQQPAAAVADAHGGGTSTINNRALRYGNFCGPGPAQLCTESGCSAPPGLAAADEVDESCRLHDIAYCKCGMDLEKRGGHAFPGLTQLMAVRGLLPAPLGELLVVTDVEYGRCMHEADTQLHADFKAKAESNQLPRWWEDTRLAPPGTEGTQGHEKACAIEVPGAKGACAFRSREVFLAFVDVFGKALELDQRALPLNPEPAKDAGSGSDPAFSLAAQPEPQ